MKSKLRSYGLRAKSSPAAFTVLMWFVALLYWEILLHVVAFGGFHWRNFYMLGFTALIAVLASLLCTMFPRRINRIVFTVLLIAAFVLYTSQLIYLRIFGSFYSVSMMQMGGKALQSFWKETSSTVIQNILLLLAMLVPVIASFFAKKINPRAFTQLSWRRGLQVLGLLAVSHIVLVLLLFVGGTKFYTPYDYYWSDDIGTDQSIECFGFLTTARLELQHMYLGSERQKEDIEVLDEGSVKEDAEAEAEAGKATYTADKYNVDPTLDFTALNELTDDVAYRTLNYYFNDQIPTKKNEYTGKFKGYNLIMICAESFSPAAIDKDLTPTLYKLVNGGFVFNNYYNTFPNVTTNGEYTFCTGLLPDLTRSKSNASFYASRNSYLPYCMGNVFSEQLGIQSYAYHNYKGSYYHRDETHPNMGYRFFSAGNGMHFTTNWPASDLEMFEQSVDDYLSQDQFHAYYMTFSGHYKYDTEINPMCARNYNVVKDMPYNEAAKCYLSCNYELEKGLTYLMNRLQSAGVLDKTVIVLTGDHFPYGLTNSQYSELVGYQLDAFNKYKGTFICYNSAMDPVQVDAYCCNMDILPTLMNLFGFEYDSRLVMGTDVLSDSRHIAVLANQSFLTDDVWFNSTTGDAIWQNGKTADKEYLNALINYVKNRFTISTAILNTSYYDFAFHHEFIITDDNGNVITQPALPALPDGETVPPDEEGETETTGGAVPDDTEQATPETTNAG